jgi:hypothetical protein
MSENNVDKVIVLAVLLAFIGLLVFFHRENFATEFLEQSSNLALGALLGLVKGSSNSKGDK